MRYKIQWVLKHSFWMSLLLHLLLLASFSLVYTFKTNPPPPLPSMEIPSYVYNGEVPPVTRQQTLKNEAENSPIGIEKPVTTTSAAAKNQTQAMVQKSEKKTEAIHLVGDKKTPPKPLVKLLGKGLAAHLVYPKIATDFNLKGISMIGFTLHPDGHLTDIQVVKTSGADILDNAALAGVKAMSPLKDVNLYLQSPQFLIVGIIFSGNEPVGRLMI